MLISVASLNRLMGLAYKGSGGLWVMNTGATWRLGGARWRVEVRHDFLPRKCLAKIVELAGRLPGRDEGFVVDKEGVDYTTSGPAFKSAMESFRAGDADYEATRMIVVNTEACRVLQSDTQEESTIFIAEKFYEMISPLSVDQRNGEGPIVGPRTYKDASWRQSEGICWGTDQMAIAITPAEACDTKRETDMLALWHITRTNETAKAKEEGGALKDDEIGEEVAEFAKRVAKRQEAREAKRAEFAERVRRREMKKAKGDGEGSGTEEPAIAAREAAESASGSASGEAGSGSTKGAGANAEPGDAEGRREPDGMKADARKGDDNAGRAESSGRGKKEDPAGSGQKAGREEKAAGSGRDAGQEEEKAGSGRNMGEEEPPGSGSQSSEGITAKAGAKAGQKGKNSTEPGCELPAAAPRTKSKDKAAREGGKTP